MMPQLSVAVIGTGFGEHAAAPAYRSAGFDVEVISPRDDAAVRRALTSDVDLVSVHSPPFLHVEHVAGAVDNGRAVLCDKPFGRNATDAADMRERAVSAGVPHFLNFEFRYRESWAKLKELVEAGTIGAPTHLSWTFFGSGLRGRKYGWINDRELGGGWIGAYGSHIIDFTRWLFGSEVSDCGARTRIEEPKRIDADGTHRDVTAEDGYSAWLTMASGATALHDTGFAGSVMIPPYAVLTGSAGAIELFADTRLVVRRPDVREAATHEFGRPGRGEPDPALVAFFTDVADVLRGETRRVPTFDDGLAVAEVMDRLRS